MIVSVDCRERGAKSHKLRSIDSLLGIDNQTQLLLLFYAEAQFGRRMFFFNL